MIPSWKLKRELGRLGQQLAYLPYKFFEPISRWKYNRKRWNLIKIHSGESELQQKICIFLVYQPKGISDSTLETLAFFKENGYTSIVVSNAPICETDLQKMSRFTLFTLIRPNYGYDFGGFRDAVHFVQYKGYPIKNIILLNDSIIFPFNKDALVLNKLESSPCDLTGLLLHIPRRNEEILEKQLIRKRVLPVHIESYLIHISEEAFKGAAFISFWKNYKQSNSKWVTIKRGEIGLSKAMQSAGLRIGGISQRSEFISNVLKFSDIDLEKTLKYAAYSDQIFDNECQAILQSNRDEKWRALALDHIQKVVMRRRFNASFCWANEKIFGTSFQKKLTGRLFEESRRKFLQAVDAGDLCVNNMAAIKELRYRVEEDYPDLAPNVEQS